MRCRWTPRTARRWNLSSGGWSRRSSERDLNVLSTLLAEDVELRSNAIGGELAVGRADVLAAVEANRDLLFDPVLLSFNHLGDGWMIVPARLRHSIPLGGIADSTKTVLARVLDGKVSVSLVFRDVGEARAEYEQRTGRSTPPLPSTERHARRGSQARSRRGTCMCAERFHAGRRLRRPRTRTYLISMPNEREQDEIDELLRQLESEEARISRRRRRLHEEIEFKRTQRQCRRDCRDTRATRRARRARAS